MFFLNPAWSRCRHVYKPVVSFIKNRVCQFVNTTYLIVIGHYIAIYQQLRLGNISKAINTDPQYEYSPWLLISATLYNKTIVISMLNCYCREHLIIFYAFCGTCITVGAQYATFTLSGCPGASIEQWEILFITQYFNFILVDNEESHSVEITSWIRYLSFFTV